MQNEIKRIQALYREWLQLHEQLTAAEQNWQRSNQIMQELSTFYFGGQFREFYEAIENGAKVDLRTEGEYSIMSEDALWDAFQEHRELAEQRVQTSLPVLENPEEEK